MNAFDPDVIAAHAQHVHLYSTQLRTAKQHADHDGTWTGIALGVAGQVLALPMDYQLSAFGDTLQALCDRADDVGRRIDHTATVHRITEQANRRLMDTTKTRISDPDLVHWPRTINDFPDSGIVSDIGSFASNCPQYSQAGGVALGLGITGLAFDVLGYVLDPVGNVFGTLAGLIIDLCVPLKEVVDALMGDPGALQDSSTAFLQIATFLSETAHTFAASLGEITPRTWDEPGASDRYLQVARNLVQLAIDAGSTATALSGDILAVGSFLGDLRSGVFDHVVGFVIEAIIEAATGVALAPATLGASVGVAAGIITTEFELTAASIALQVAGAIARLSAAALVAQEQGRSYEKLVADIKT